MSDDGELLPEDAPAERTYPERGTRAERARLGFEDEPYIDFPTSPTFRAAFAELGLTAPLPDGYPLEPPRAWEPLPILDLNEREWREQQAEIERLMQVGRGEWDAAEEPDAPAPPTQPAPKPPLPLRPSGRPTQRPKPQPPTDEPPPAPSWRHM